MFIPHMDDCLNELAALAEPEEWDYHRTETDNQKPILYNYLRYTYQRLTEEEKIVVSDDGQFITRFSHLPEIDRIQQWRTRSPPRPTDRSTRVLVRCTKSRAQARSRRLRVGLEPSGGKFLISDDCSMGSWRTVDIVSVFVLTRLGGQLFKIDCPDIGCLADSCTRQLAFGQTAR